MDKLISELKSLMTEKNLSIPMASKACKCSTRSFYRWIAGEGYQVVKLRKVINKLKTLKENK